MCVDPLIIDNNGFSASNVYKSATGGDGELSQSLQSQKEIPRDKTESGSDSNLIAPRIKQWIKYNYKSAGPFL